MQTSSRPAAPVADIALRGGIVGLALATASIHSTLGGGLFTLNAAGYVALAGALVLPGRIFRDLRWLTRLALIGYTLTTIVGWYVIGPRYDLAYVAKGIELVLVTLLVVESYHLDGSPVEVGRRVATRASRLLSGRAPRPSFHSDHNR